MAPGRLTQPKSDPVGYLKEKRNEVGVGSREVRDSSERIGEGVEVEYSPNTLYACV